jgi:two-component system, NarL family, response regulator DesR
MIVADPGLLLGAVSAVLANEPDVDVIGQVDLAGGLPPLADLEPNVAVIDMDLPGGRWAPIARRFNVDVPDCAVVVLTGQPTPRALRQALHMQARGFVSKRQPPGELVEVIRRVAAGDRVIDPTTAAATLTTARNPLTEREREVLRLAAEGMPSKAISQALFLTYGTVRNHLSAIMRKTGARNRLDAIRRARDAGWM